MTSLSDRVVLVTGGSAGIGRSTVTRLAADGARVVTCARHGDRLEEAFGGLPGVCTTVADVADAGDRAALLDRVLDEHGRLDAVVHNAGVGWAGLLEDMPGESVEGIVALNLTGVVELTRLALPHLLRSAADRGRADVVMVSSVAAWSQVPPLTVYSATKAGVQGFARGLRREVTTRGIRVHTVNPFFVETEWLARGHGHPPVSGEDARGRLSRGISPDRVADRIGGLLRSPRSRTVTVPRWAGLARLGEAPPVDRVLDRLLSGNADRIRRIAARTVAERVD
ncbi:SDR family NAD(P)-dependent oxidoreductase [Blastococcus saxobsidens]|uniref:Putative 3-oxoacyl-acyl carrier protein reductase (FabG-like) n=1 Tax=Blastococcus saxobsidens (strain DD2) TaxID=1146883 RepID=H6RRX1_BLASD|nr:SDR family oxidoreductase [Blastococcus saxobsidens]CCG02965.1 putative 3-oxoacyl-acyl carrier protein reductase (fabG-like) [Blastococcus saxobsidens DD2]